MKKSVFAVAVWVVTLFVTAVGACVGVLQGSRAVSAFDEGGMRIVLDAGHGGIDGGVVGRTTGAKESNINLAITHSLKDVLEDMGFEVTLTRKTEGGLYGAPTKGFKRRDMERRKEIIEEASPRLVVSVHQNYYPSKSVRGGQVFYNAENAQGKRLAECLQTQVNALYEGESVSERTAKSGEYYMLECTSYPSVIVECGFLSNAEDEKLLLTATWRKKLAEAMVRGITFYLSGSTA